MKKDLLISVRFTLATTALAGLAYPLAVTGLAQLLFREQANGQLIEKENKLVGSRLIGQPFSGPGYFHPRPSAAGTGYDATSSGGSNLAPTNKDLIKRVGDGARELMAENPAGPGREAEPVPVDLVTTSASGLDPDISPAGARYQVSRVARARGMSESELEALVERHTQGRQWGFLGEPRVSVLELNLDLDASHPLAR
jgi:potassium-transporting ATPase KdpC subunit